MGEGMKWRCNAYPDRVEQLSDERLGKCVALHHADATELILGGEVGEFRAEGEEMRKKFESEGIVGIWVPEGR